MSLTSGTRTISLLTFLNVLSALLGILNTVIVAYYFGTGRSVEVYLAAVGLYASVVGLAQTGQVSEVLLPSYHALQVSHGRDEARRAYSGLVNRFLAVLAVGGLIAWLLAPQLTKLRVPGFGAADISLAAAILRWIVPLIVLQVAAELLKTLANAERMYGAPDAAGLMARGFSLAALILLAQPLGVWAMVVGLWFATSVEVVAILSLLWRRGYRHRLSFAIPASAGAIGLFGKMGATLPYVGLTQIFSFVFDAALSQLPQGSFAVFRYATMIWGRTQGIFLRPLSVPFFTEFADSAARRLPAGAHMVETALARVLAVTMIVSTAVFVGAERVLSGLWQGDRFPPDKISTVVWILAGLYLMLPLTGLALVLRKATVALHRIRETYTALAIVQALSTVIVWWLVTRLGLPGAVIVMATNLLGFCAAPIIVLRVCGDSFKFSYPIGRLWRWILAVGIGTAVGMLADRWIEFSLAVTADSRLASIAIGCVLASVGVAVTFGVTLLLRVPESSQLVRSTVRAFSGHNGAET